MKSISWKCSNPYLLSAIDDEKLPLLPRSINALLVGLLNLFQGNGNLGSIYFVKALEIQEQTAMPLLKPIFKLHQVGCHICLGDLASAQNSLDNTFTDINPKQRMVLSLFHFYTGWLYALRGQLSLALEQNEHALLMNQVIKNNVGTVCCLGLKAQLLAETAQWEMAEQALLSLASINQQSPNKIYQLQYHLSDAWIGFLSNNQKRALAGIKQFLQVVRHEQIKFFLGWRPNVITPLCLLAIEHGIEEKFALRMMQVNALIPPPPKHLEQWPWLVRIYCFNQVQIELNGQRLKQEGKSQKKVIELLLTIIALGGQDVSGEKVCDVLWPDSDGDMAKQALKTAIFRLRNLIGKSTVLVSDGKISLNEKHCWIDLWAFETTFQELDDELRQNNNDALVIELSNRLLHLYQGSFLKQMDSGVIKFKQEQLQNKILRMLNRLTYYHEKRQEHGRICWLLDQGLERVPQLGADCQRLISYHQEVEIKGYASQQGQQFH